MSDYLNQTEEQQFEEAKSWLKRNGTPILMAITVVLATSAGWNFWKNHQLESSLKMSVAYQQIMESYLQNPEKNTPLVEKFIQDNSGANYAVFAQLELAKQRVVQGDFAKAKRVLTQALSESREATLQSVIRLRLAAIEFQMQEFDAALATLSKVTDSAWQVRKHVLTGDILMAKGENAAAKTAYETAKEKASADEQVMIDLRLNNL